MKARMNLDIHNYARKFEETTALVEHSEISQRNKELILAYRDACLLQQTCSKVRLIRIMGALLLAARTMKIDFDTATREDVQRLIATWMARQPSYSAETLGTYKGMIKRFYTWLVAPAAFSSTAPPPPIVAWLTTHVRKKDKKKLQRTDLLMPGDIQRVISVCRTSRDRALVSTLWETGGRIAEVGNRHVRDAVPANVGYTLELDGKTGPRSVLVVSSAPLLAQWLNDHPFKHDPDAPLWVHLRTDAPRLLMYAALRKLLIELFREAGITKRVYPHLFRHSRATYCLASGLMTEAQAKAYFGWSPDSAQLATYAHLLASDANNAILRENNLIATTEHHDELRATKCYRCAELNATMAEYCTRCGAVLDLKKAYEHQQLHDMKEELFTRMFKVMVERGLVDEAARAIHDARLGGTLKRLAQHASGEIPIVKETVKPDTARTNADVNPAQVIPSAEVVAR
jgi:integrase